MFYEIVLKLINLFKSISFHQRLGQSQGIHSPDKHQNVTDLCFTEFLLYIGEKMSNATPTGQVENGNCAYGSPERVSLL